MNPLMNPQRGDIILVNFDPALPSEAASTRPAIVLSNDDANDFLDTIIVLPLTKNISRIYPHEFILEKARTGLDFDSKAQVQYLRHVSRKRIKRLIGLVPNDLMNRIGTMVRDHLNL